MKLLTAAVGTGSTDFAGTVPGELVYLAFPCARDRKAVDPADGCGCSRAFVGLATARGTTLAIVTEVDITRDQLVDAMRDSLERHGWPTDPAEFFADDMIDDGDEYETGEYVRRHYDDLLPVGTVENG